MTTAMTLPAGVSVSAGLIDDTMGFVSSTESVRIPVMGYQNGVNFESYLKANVKLSNGSTFYGTTSSSNYINYFNIATEKQLAERNETALYSGWLYHPFEITIYSTKMGGDGLTRVYEIKDGEQEGEFIYDDKYYYIAHVKWGGYEEKNHPVDKNIPYSNTYGSESVYILDKNFINVSTADGKELPPMWKLIGGWRDGTSTSVGLGGSRSSISSYIQYSSENLKHLVGVYGENLPENKKSLRTEEFSGKKNFTMTLDEFRVFFDDDSDGYKEGEKYYVFEHKCANGDTSHQELPWSEGNEKVFCPKCHALLSGTISEDGNIRFADVKYTGGDQIMKLDVNALYEEGPTDPMPAVFTTLGNRIYMPGNMGYQKVHWEADTTKVYDYGFGTQTVKSTVFGSFAGTEALYVERVKKSKSPIKYTTDPPKEGDPYPEGLIPELEDVPVSIDALDPHIVLPKDPRVTTVPESLDNHGDVYLIKNATVIDVYSNQDFDYGSYYVPDYDKDSTYFIAIETNVNNKKDKEDPAYCDYNIYRWDPNYNYWEFRCNTNSKQTEVKVSPEFFPLENAKASLWKRSTDKASEEQRRIRELRGDFDPDYGTMIQDWSKKDFNNSNKTATIDMENFLPGDNFYTVLFNYKDNGIKLYRYVGIDPVDVKTSDSRTESDVTMVPTTARIGDTVHVVGTGDDGSKADYDYYISAKGDVPVREGTFRLEDKDTGLYADVTVKDGKVVSPEELPVNLTDPINVDSYTIKKPNGEVIETGKPKKGLFDSIDDTGLKLADLENDALYHPYTYEKGTKNAINQEFVKESGYIVVQGDDIKKILDSELGAGKGDVNIDGKVDVLDIVFLTKYVHNNQSFTFKNYINGDLNEDGLVDVFDMGALKSILLNK